jgi:hypothetical protein
LLAGLFELGERPPVELAGILKDHRGLPLEEPLSTLESPLIVRLPLLIELLAL